MSRYHVVLSVEQDLLLRNFCLYRSIICDVSMERVALNILLLFCQLGTSDFLFGKLFNSFPHVSKTSTAAMENSVEIS